MSTRECHGCISMQPRLATYTRLAVSWAIRYSMTLPVPLVPSPSLTTGARGIQSGTCPGAFLA